MNLGRVCFILGRFALFFTLLQALMLGFTLFEGSGDSSPTIHATTGFGAGVGAGLLASALLWWGGRGCSDEFFRREGLTVVGLSWLLAGVLGAVPFLWSGALASAADGIFESVSGLTTTGASVCGSGGNHAIEDLPASLLLWRSALQWLGGLGIILVFLIVLPAFGVTGKNLLSSEAVGVGSESARPRMQEQARLLLRLYIALTAAEAVALFAIGGMSIFDSLNHALTTMATGGFSTRNASIGAYDSVAVEMIVLVFMFLAGANFPLLMKTLRPGQRTKILTSPEFRLYAGITLVATLITAVALWMNDRAPVLESVRQAAFQVVSVLTSTGYATENFQTWPAVALMTLWFCMFVGGCTGSTAGGYKVLRVLLGAKLVGYQINKFIRPNSVARIKLANEVLTSTTISSVLALLLLWIGCVVLGGVLVGLDDRIDLVSALTASQSMMSCTGPAMTAVVPEVIEGVNGATHVQYAIANAGGLDLGPFGGFGQLHGWTKLVLAFQMVLGRLEILTPLVLFAPAVWRK